MKYSPPSHWVKATLGEVSDFKNGKAFKSSEWSKDGLPIIRIQNVNSEDPTKTEFNYFKGEYSSDIIVENSDLLFCWSGSLGTSFGPRIWKGPRGLLNQHIFKVNLKADILKEFYFYQMKANIKLVEDRAHGGVGLTHITKGELSKVPFSYPPLSEQKQIVAKIESTSEKIKAIDSAVTQAEWLLSKYKESLLAKAFRGQLVPQDPNDESASKLLERIRADRAKTETGKKKKKYELPPIAEDEIPFEIPKSWEWVRLSEITSKIVDGTHHTPKYTDSGIHFLSAKDIIDGSVSFRNTKFITKDEHDLLIKRCHPEVGDILCTKSGTIGRTAVVYETPPFSLFESVALIKPMPVVVSEYLEMTINLFVNSHAGAGKIKGAAIKHLHLEDLRLTPIPLPPLNEQKRIMVELREAFKAHSVVTQNLKSIRMHSLKLGTSILTLAFNGGLTK